MHLKRIELTNYRQHRNLDVDFNGNLIAIIARNGAGKSNLLGAIQYALTGEHPGATKADLTTWGEKDGSVRLFFTAGPRNEEFVVTRKTNGDVTLKVGDEVIKQAKKVEAALQEKAGIDKELVKQIVFVKQAGVDAILFDDPKNREVAFQRLIGIGNASKIYTALGAEISAIDKPQGFDEAIARSKAQLAEQENILSTCKKALLKYDVAVSNLPSKESLEAEVDRLAGAQGAVDEYISVCQRLSDAQALHELALKKLNDMGAVSETEEENLRKEVAGLQDLLTGLRGSTEQGKEAVRYLTRLKELSEATVSAKAQMESAEAKLKEVTGRYSTTLEEDDAEAKRLANAQVAAESEVRSLNNLAKAASSDGTCPVCGAPASQEEIARHMKEKLEAAEKARKEAIKKSSEALMAYDKRHAEETEARRDVERKKFAYDSAFAGLKKAHDANVDGCCIDLLSFEVSFRGATTDMIPEIQATNEKEAKQMSEINDRISKLSFKIGDIEATKAKARDARDNVSRCAAQIDMLIQSKMSAAKRLADMGIDPESAKDGSESRKAAAAKARSNLDAYNGILRDMAAERGRLEAAQKTIESTKKFIEDLVEKKELEDKVKAKIDTLKRVRDWFHYREGPRIMSQNVMRDLTACVNNYLDQFNAPFIVEAEEEGFGFRCCFIDGRTMPNPHPDASLLSGGQKVALAIAFRLAIYMCFGGELGLLSLDEPTAYLDDSSIEHLGELLQKIGEVARNKGLQILMATHEKAIMPFLDSRIDLNALKGE